MALFLGTIYINLLFQHTPCSALFDWNSRYLDLNCLQYQSMKNKKVPFYSLLLQMPKMEHIFCSSKLLAIIFLDKCSLYANRLTLSFLIICSSLLAPKCQCNFRLRCINQYYIPFFQLGTSIPSCNLKISALRAYIFILPRMA